MFSFVCQIYMFMNDLVGTNGTQEHIWYYQLIIPQFLIAHPLLKKPHKIMKIKLTISTVKIIKKKKTTTTLNS